MTQVKETTPLPGWVELDYARFEREVTAQCLRRAARAVLRRTLGLPVELPQPPRVDTGRMQHCEPVSARVHAMSTRDRIAWEQGLIK